MQSQEHSLQRRESLEISLLSSETIKYENQGTLRLCVIVIRFSTAYYGWTVVELSAVPQKYLTLSYGPEINNHVTYGLLQGSVPAGAIIGALISSSIMKLFTRKQFILFVNLLALIVQGVLQVPNIYILLVCRVFQGIFVGNYMAIVPIYINDLSPKQIVASFGVFTNRFVVVAIVICFSLQIIFEQAIHLAPEPFWRIIWGANSVLIILQSILLLVNFVPESPNSLIMKGKMREAKIVIGMFHKEQYVEENFVLRMEEVNLEQSQNKTETKIKISPIAYLVAFQLPLMQQFVGVGSVSAQVGNIIGTYNSTLGLYLPLIVNSVQLVGNFSAVFLLKSMGRKTVALLGNGGVGLIDLAIAVLFIFINDGNGIIIAVTVFLILYMLLFGLTLGPITWLYIPEIIPANMVPYATVDNWVAATIVYSMTPMVVGAFGGNPSVLFFIFTGLTFIFFVINALFMVETKGLNREEIANKFLQKWGDKQN